ncbi:capsular polysaccharide biosynthesis protein [Pantoea sp. 18069]|uniref:capsular polysaccharide biosynthesis protein n=1 Tax=Pantoea sp. 18069 TaxID=2681415 RepID=UPI00190F262F|nr:capsular polysaccharide biosynthesis protein [Pantoea sp. 18069]
MNKKIGIFSNGILNIPFLSVLLDSTVVALRIWHRPFVNFVAGWGMRPSTYRSRSYARTHDLPYLALEDGFLRSFGTGDIFPPISIVLDGDGIYYDCTKVSALERMLNSADDVLYFDSISFRRAQAKLLQCLLSKYNNAPVFPANTLRPKDRARVLVIDQTNGDMSVTLGGADARTFEIMLAAAKAENPEATVYVKTHPEVASGRKGGYLTSLHLDEQTVLLRDAVNPLSLIKHMDHVYVVTSTMGFEALLAGKPVTCFGMPWYAGWGATDDRQADHPAARRRTRVRSVDELFAAAYVHYTRYLNPETRQLGSIWDGMQWLSRQREVAQRFPARMICVGFRRWKAANLKSMLSLFPGKVVFVKNAQAAAALFPKGDDCLVCWGLVPPRGMESLANETDVRLLRMEDGFVRSVGLGSDLIPPQSFVLDAKGIYFDPSGPSELEDMLNTRAFSPDDLQRARKVRETIVVHGITKYNLEPVMPVQWPGVGSGQQVVLVPGQVEDDASIRFGCDTVNGVHTNLGLLQAARTAYPQAFIVYKPHPDVMSGNRRGKLMLNEARQWADHVELQTSVVSCIDACDVVVTMTSLTGFDALLRGKTVVVHGRPFYAGWGLTQDMLPVPRRERQLGLDALVAGALLHYPLYWDPVLRGYTTCEAVLLRIVEERQRLEQNGGLKQLKLGYVRRQARKMRTLLRSLRII